ncbi:MAG: hypothetical protein ABIJ18_01545 [archaeon]
MGELEDLRAKFLKAYANLPEPEMELVIVIIDDKPISWNKANKEIEDKTELGNKILKKLKILEIL